MVFKPDRLQLPQIRVTQVCHRFYFFPIEIVLHHIVDYFVLLVAIAVDEQPDKVLKGIVLDLTQLQEFFAILEHF
jgi:hypothetical protein